MGAIRERMSLSSEESMQLLDIGKMNNSDACWAARPQGGQMSGKTPSNITVGLIELERDSKPRDPSATLGRPAKVNNA